MSNGTDNLQDKTLAELQALRATLTSTNWLIQMMNASAEQKQQNADLRILLDAKIGEMENAQFAQIRDQLNENKDALNGAIADMQDALGDIEDIEKVLKAATQILKVVAKVLAVVA